MVSDKHEVLKRMGNLWGLENKCLEDLIAIIEMLILRISLSSLFWATNKGLVVIQAWSGTEKVESDLEGCEYLERREDDKEYLDGVNEATNTRTGVAGHEEMEAILNMSQLWLEIIIVPQDPTMRCSLVTNPARLLIKGPISGK